MKLLSKTIIKGTIEVVTGISIGSSNTSLAIGGVDKAVIRNPIDNKPYIPGSSLKGKMRSLLEKSLGINGDILDESSISSQLFGYAGKDENKKYKQRQSRVLVRDGRLLSDKGDFKFEDLPYTEAKTEVVINRQTSEATPRTIERVPAGAQFELELLINTFDGESELSEDQAISTILKCLNLVSNDYLGGSGSRGSGQVRFKVERISRRTTEYYLSGESESILTDKYQTIINSLANK